MSFRHNKNKNQASAGAEEQDVKVSYAKSSQSDAPAQQEQQVAPQQPVAVEHAEQSQQPTSEPVVEDNSGDSTEDSSEGDEPASEPVPDGSTAEILRWVGTDKQRAQAAFDKEQADDRPRHGLTGELKKVLSSSDGSQEA
jgi:hypothetical protein